MIGDEERLVARGSGEIPSVLAEAGGAVGFGAFLELGLGSVARGVLALPSVENGRLISENRERCTLDKNKPTITQSCHT